MRKVKFWKMSGLVSGLLISLRFVFLLPSVSGQQTTADWLKTAQQRIDTLRKGNFTINAFDKNGDAVSDSISIKLKRHEFVFGCANDFDQSNYSSDPALPSNNDWIKANILKYFNLNVTGNAFKWSGTQPNSATTYNYGPVDSIVNWSVRSGFNLKGHCMIWPGYNDSDYHLIPKWVHQLSTNQAIYNACKTRVQSMAMRYKGKFKEYDILNEPLHALWLKNKLGTDSIYWNCFKWAKEIDTTTKLYINEYNVEFTNSWSDAIGYKALIKKILSHGGPVEGIGVQAHFSGDFDVTRLADLKKNMDTLATLGLPMKFTEFDLDSTSQSKQASNTAAIFRFAFSHPSFNGIISWGFWDAGVWRPKSGYFDVSKNPKLAADTIYNLIHNIWTTKISSILVNSNINFKGYYGQYEVKVKFGNTWKQFSIGCNKIFNDSTFVLREQNGTMARPQFISVRLISNNQVLVKFDKKMNDPSFSIRAFKIFQVNPLKINSISLLSKDSSVVSMILATSVNKNLITISYSDGNLTSTDGGVLEAFGPEKIDNNYTALLSASSSKDGKTVEAKFNKPLVDPSGQLANFTILANSISVGIDSVRLKSGNDSVMVFSLSTMVQGGDAITLSYVAGSVTSKDGHELASFINFSVINIVPNLLLNSASTSKDGKKIEAGFNMPITDPSAQLASFTILVNNISVGVDSVRLKNGNDSIIVFTLSVAVKVGDIIKLSYVQGSVISKGGQKLASFSNFSVLNRVPKLDLISASTSKDGKIIEATFNKPMADPSAQLSSFKILTNDISAGINSVQLKNGNDSVMIFTLSSAIKKDDDVLLFYYAGNVASSEGEKLVTIRMFPVLNIVEPTGIEEQKFTGFALYPNPAISCINLKSNIQFNLIRISNLMGKLILEKVVNGDDVQIDVSSLPAGSYIISAISSNGIVLKTKLIKIK